MTFALFDLIWTDTVTEPLNTFNQGLSFSFQLKHLYKVETPFYTKPLKIAQECKIPVVNKHRLSFCLHGKANVFFISRCWVRAFVSGM